MKTKYKIVFIIFVFSLLGNGGEVFAQQKSKKVDTLKRSVDNRFTISGGIGYSAGMVGIGIIGGIFFPIQYNYWPADAELYIDASPEFGASINYDISNRFGIGFAMGYESEYFSYDQNDVYTDKISRLNFAVRGLIHLNNYNARFDHYFGVRIGCSYWQDENLTTPNLGQVIGAPSLYRPSFQILYGLTLFPGGGCFGFNFEVGIGTPYLGQVGILFRL